MRISTRSRYGLRLMLVLAANYGQKPVLLREIAANEGISEKYLSQIIIPLRSAGLVNSSRGVHGGYSLSRHPKHISVRDVVAVFEGDFILVDCLKNRSFCKRAAKCVTQEIWNNLGKVMVQALQAVTLEDLAVKYRGKINSEGLYQI